MKNKHNYTPLGWWSLWCCTLFACVAGCFRFARLHLPVQVDDGHLAVFCVMLGLLLLGGLVECGLRLALEWRRLLADAEKGSDCNNLHPERIYGPEEP